MMEFQVKGMSCAACVARVEKAVCGVEGVNECAVNLLTNSMRVEGDVSSAAIADAVAKAGYEAVAVSAATEPTAVSDKTNVSETSHLKQRLISSIVLLAVLMYISMGHTMWSWPMPAFFEGNAVALGLLQLLLSAAVLVINGAFFISGVKSLWRLSPNMDALVA
ncbi:MAG: cation-translocating P-type ATPase, partial [Clostridia bacterium]|nr:cation-translocating P-type ATPase [Clostridia bacterium]